MIEKLEQLCMEDKYSKHNIRANLVPLIESRIERQFTKAVVLLEEFFNNPKGQRLITAKEMYIDSCGLSLEELIVEVCLVVWSTKKALNIQTVVSKLMSVMELPDSRLSAELAANIVVVLAKANVFDLNTSPRLEVKARHTLDKECFKYLAQLKYLPPMVCQPRHVNSNTHSGYLSKRESLILGKGNHHEDYLCYDAINIANRTKMSLDKDVLRTPEPMPDGLTGLPKKQWEAFNEASQEVYQELLDAGNEFHFDWRYDKRGRMYSSGYHVNIQSTEYKKALINLAEPQIIRK